MVQFSVAFSQANSPSLSQLTEAEKAAVLLNISAAATWWSRYIAPGGPTLNIEVDVDDSAFSGNTLAQAGPSNYFNTGRLDNGVRVYEPVGNHEIEIGANTNGSSDDIDITLTVNAIRNLLYFRPDPFASSASVPNNRADAVSVFLHEIGHGLGILSFSDSTTDTNFTTTRRTAWDEHITTTGGSSFFDAPSVDSLLGEALPLQPGDISHVQEAGVYGNTTMSPTITDGTIVNLSRLEIAIIGDMGLPLRVPTAGADTIYGFTAQGSSAYNNGIDTINLLGGNDLAYGLSGADTINGGTGDDTLEGDAGNDALDGGGGLDKAVYSGARSAYTVTRNASNWTVSGSEGTDTLTNIEQLAFTDQTLVIRESPVADFDGGGAGDIVWHNANGQTDVWMMNGLTIAGAGAAGPNPGASWQVAGTGDFNGDGTSDLLWHNANGQADIWLMSGLSTIGAGSAGPNPGTSWQVAGTGDFNGDGDSDIVWRNVNGQADIWLMNGLTRIGGGAAGSNPGTSWRLAGTGDFNGDGRSDIIWQNVNGQADIWEMNGTTIIGAGAAGGNPGTAWQVAGTGDFNGDGDTDIIWRHDSGQVDIWLMNGLNIIGAGAAGGNPGTSWQVAGTGDYNGDGKSDLLWHNVNGQADIWLMNGVSVISAGAAGPNPGTSWQIAPTG